MAKQWHGGKGDKSRISDMNKFSRNMEKIYETKNWRFWATWEGYDLDEIDFDDSGIDQFEQISYSEFVKRLKNKK